MWCRECALPGLPFSLGYLGFLALVEWMWCPLLLCVLGPRITGGSRYYIGGSAGNRPRTSNTSEVPATGRNSFRPKNLQLQSSQHVSTHPAKAQTHSYSNSIAIPTVAEAGPRTQSNKGRHSHSTSARNPRYPSEKGNPGRAHSQHHKRITRTDESTTCLLYTSPSPRD